MDLKDRIKEKRLECGYTLEELANMIGTSKQTIHRYESGVIANIPSDKIEAIAKALNTTPAYLMGWESTKAPIYEAAAGEGRINDGYPSEEYPIRLEPDQMIIRVRGRSMEPTLLDGDLVVVTAQNEVDHTRQIALVKVNGDEATLKRVTIERNGITLTADNGAVYEPHYFSQEKVEGLPVRIEGVVTQLIREL